MEVHLKYIVSEKLLEKNILPTCEYFCHLSSSDSNSLELRELGWLALSKLVRTSTGSVLSKITSRIQVIVKFSNYIGLCVLPDCLYSGWVSELMF